MDKMLFNQEIRLSYNTAGKCEELCVVINECMSEPYFVIRCKNKHGWKMEKHFYDTKTAMAAWNEIKELKEIE